MLNSARKIVTAVVLTSALAVATTTPSQAQWYGWGWGAPVVAVAPAYGGYYGYSAYGYPTYGWGYPAYAYSYGGPPYATYGYGIVGYRVPAGYAGYGPAPPSYVGQSYGFVSPSYGYYTYASPYYRTYRQARRYVAGPAYAKARARTAERSYATAPGYNGLRDSHIYRASSHVVGTAAHSRLTHPTTVVPRARTVGGHGVMGADVSQNVGGSAAAPEQRGASIRAANASVGLNR
jgi:hypothetical protein